MYYVLVLSPEGCNQEGCVAINSSPQCTGVQCIVHVLAPECITFVILGTSYNYETAFSTLSLTKFVHTSILVVFMCIQEVVCSRAV